MTAPLVCLHGTFGQASDWDQLADDLGREVIAPDLPGHGARYAEPANSFADTVRELVDQTPPGADLLGYSLGGRLALAVARQARVRSLAIESAHPGLAGEQAAARAVADDAGADQLAADPALFMERFYGASLFESFRALPQFRTIASDRLARARRDPAALAATLRALSPGRQPDLAPALAATQIPTLFVAGAKDPKYTELGARLARTCEHVQLAVIPNAGHNVHLEQPGAFAQTVRAFWGTLA